MMKIEYKIYHNDILLYTGVASNYIQRIAEHKYHLRTVASPKHNFELYKYIRQHNLNWDDLTIIKADYIPKRNIKFAKNEFYSTIDSKELKIHYYEHIQQEILNNQNYYKTRDNELFAVFQ